MLDARLKSGNYFIITGTITNMSDKKAGFILSNQVHNGSDGALTLQSTYGKGTGTGTGGEIILLKTKKSSNSLKIRREFILKDNQLLKIHGKFT